MTNVLKKDFYREHHLICFTFFWQAFLGFVGSDIEVSRLSLQPLKARAGVLPGCRACPRALLHQCAADMHRAPAKLRVGMLPSPNTRPMPGDVKSRGYLLPL